MNRLIYLFPLYQRTIYMVLLAKCQEMHSSRLQRFLSFLVSTASYERLKTDFFCLYLCQLFVLQDFVVSFCSGCHKAACSDNGNDLMKLLHACSSWSVMCFYCFLAILLTLCVLVIPYLCFIRNCRKLTKSLHRNYWSWRKPDKRRKRLEISLFSAASAPHLNAT